MVHDFYSLNRWYDNDDDDDRRPASFMIRGQNGYAVYVLALYYDSLHGHQLSCFKFGCVIIILESIHGMPCENLSIRF